MIVITGMRAEARIASAPGVRVFACGGNVDLRAHAIRHAVFAGAPAIISFGIAGGLCSDLNPGDWIVATGVSSEHRRIETDVEWSSRLISRLPSAELGDIVSVASPVRTPEDKRRLHISADAIAVDMESFDAAALASELGVPFAAVRVIADPVSRELPPAIHVGLRPDGTAAMGPVMRSLLRQPSQIPSLARVSTDAFIAIRALLKGRDRLGPLFASLMCPTVRRADAPFGGGIIRARTAPLTV